MGRASQEKGGQDLWDLSIEDLFAAPEPEAEGVAEAGGPYVINLATSVEPISIPTTTLAEVAHLTLYQVTGWKHDRLLFRLRLGPMDTALEADAIFEMVRREYPDAETLSAREEDMRMIAAVTATAQPRRRPAPAKRAPSSVRTNTSPPATTPVAAPASSSATAPLGELAGEILLDAAIKSDPPPRAPAPARAAPSASPPTLTMAMRSTRKAVESPFHAAQLRVAATAAEHNAPVPPPATTKATPVRHEPPAARVVLPPKALVPRELPAAASPPRSVAPTTVPETPTVEIAALPVRQFEVLPGPLPDVDSTKTLRALTMTELAPDASARLFVVELILSEDEIAPAAIPNLAIFNEYRLYSTVGRADDKIMFALRLGFFRDAEPAEAVAAYLRCYFEAPRVTRVSNAERDRFAELRVAAGKDSGETGDFAAIEISSQPSAPKISLAELSARSTGSSATSGHRRRSRHRAGSR